MRYEPNIIIPGLTWSSPLTTRDTTNKIVVHHADADTADVYSIHNYHLSEGWRGIAYNFYIRKDGSIYEGRGWDYIGGHTSGYNDESVGICCEGDYQDTQPPPVAQLNSLIRMIAKSMEKYNLTINDVYGHGDLGYTYCPGNMMPLADVKNAAAICCEMEDICYTLYQKGIVNTPEYWAYCYWQLPNLSTLLTKFADECTNNTNGNTYSTVEAALSRLVSVGIINTPDYWQDNYHKITYLGDLIKSAASHT